MLFLLLYHGCTQFTIVVMFVIRLELKKKKKVRRKKRSEMKVRRNKMLRVVEENCSSFKLLNNMSTSVGLQTTIRNETGYDYKKREYVKSWQATFKPFLCYSMEQRMKNIFFPPLLLLFV